jgi:hypothetical protein
MVDMVQKQAVETVKSSMQGCIIRHKAGRRNSVFAVVNFYTIFARVSGYHFIKLESGSLQLTIAMIGGPNYNPQPPRVACMKKNTSILWLASVTLSIFLIDGFLRARLFYQNLNLGHR